MTARRKASARSLNEKEVLLNTIRTVLAISAVVVLFGILIYVTREAFFISGPHDRFGSKYYNEMTQMAIDIRLDQTRTMLQIGIGIIAALWGLLFVRKEEAVLVLEDKQNWQELLMCITSTVLLILSVICHILYSDIVTDAYINGGVAAGDKELHKAMVQSDKFSMDDIRTIPDIFSPGINYLFIAQSAFLIAGIVNTILTFVSAHKLKPKKN